MNRYRFILKPIPPLQTALILFALTAIACDLSATPTPTPMPTPTLTRSATPVPTVTPTAVSPSSGSSRGVTVTSQTDGTTLFIDLDNGYQFTLPAEWVPVVLRVNGNLTVPEQVQGSFPELDAVIESLLTEYPPLVRLMAAQTEARYLSADRPTLLLAMVNDMIPPEMMALGMSGLTAWIEDRLLSKGSSLEWDVRNNSDGIEIGINDASYDDIADPVRVHILSFVADGKLVIFQFMTPPQFSDVLFEQADTVIETIHLSAP